MNIPVRQTRFKVEGMDCASCARKIDTAARRAEGVEDVSVSVTAGTMTVTHADATDVVKLSKRIEGLGYKVTPLAEAVRQPKPVTADDSGHDHKGHDHAQHSHEGHVHGPGCSHDHDHAGHDHKGHDHEGHDHAKHSHEGHVHGPGCSPDHDHAGHDHKGHDHEGHDHAKHSHEGHVHGPGCSHDHGSKENGASGKIAATPVPPPGLEQAKFRVEGMDCASCAQKIDTAVRRIEGVRDVSVSVTGGSMLVSHQPGLDLAQVKKRVETLGYKLYPSAPAQPQGSVAGVATGNNIGLAASRPAEVAWWKTAKAQLTIWCGLALGAAFGLAQLAPSYEYWFYVAAMAVGLIPIARRALAAAQNGSPFTIETLMTIAAVGALFINAAEEAAVVVFLFLVGELLEGVAARRARASIQALADLVPKTALLEKDGKTVEVLADSLAVGQIILIRPGDRIPADGVIVTGSTSVDEAPVTGESVPKAKAPEDNVFAGTINQDAAIRVKVIAAANDNTIARIIQLVEQAQESKAPTERFIDSFSAYYTPLVMVIAALVSVVPPLFFGAVWSEWVYKGLAILLIGCPCALVISTPAAIAASLSAGARRGLLMKGGAVLESFRKVTKVAFDKTGTLTAGKPLVTDVVGVARSEKDVLELAAALELGSSHPLALAILARARASGIEPTSASDAKAIGGEGVSGTLNGNSLFLGSPKAVEKRVPLPADIKERIAALNDQGKTVSIMLEGTAVAGLLAMRDEPRADAATGIAALKKLGISAVMLTGDNKRTAAAIAGSLGMEPRAELMPQDKQRIVGELQKAGEFVAKVGDGINDAPALAAADVGIAMGGGTDVALETADAAVLHGRVMDVANMVALSRATMANIWQNISLAIALKGVFLVTTIIGLTGLWPAILADTGATVLVTANAIRLLRWRGLQAD